MRMQDKILRIMYEARKMVYPHLGKAEVIDYKSEHASDCVTKLDVDVERFMRRELSYVDKSIAFVGEEEGGDRRAPRHWLCDPIDGTAHLVRGTPHCTIMLALIEEGIITVSSIADITTGDVYYAERGQGAFCNGTRIHVKDREKFMTCLEIDFNQIDDLEMWKRIRSRAQILRTITSGSEYLHVAAGRYDGRITLHPFGEDYDYAAGSLLVEEAGGIVANLGVNTYHYKEFRHIAASPALYRALSEGDFAPFPIQE